MSTDDPIVTLHELAAEASALEESEAAQAEELLQDSVDKAVPTAEQLPGRAEENPISEQIEGIAEGQPSQPGVTTVEGGESVPR